MADQFLSLNHKQEMQQTLAPHLRQSLEVLQAPILELRTLIQKEMDQNPILEQPPEKGLEQLEVEQGTSDVDKDLNDQFEDEFSSLARLDEEWNDYFRQTRSMQSNSPGDDSRRQFFLDSITEPIFLQEHLMEQLKLTDLTEAEQRVGEMLIGSIDDDGYLSGSLEEFAEATGVPVETLMYVLSIIHDFDPIGVGARNITECLLMQLMRLGKFRDAPEYILVKEHLDKLANHRYQDIAKLMKISVEEVERCASFISTLDPKPGQRFGSSNTEYVVPEIIVQKVEGEYVIHQTNEYLPRIRISKHYKDLMGDADTSTEVRTYIREKIRAGTLLVRSIDQRQQTIHRIATEIVRVQTGFLEKGIAHLCPLTMSQVADVIGVHETTVSRAASGKYMQTPVGTFELRYFFTTGIKQADGQIVSNESIKDALARIISEEKPEKPYSDSALVKKLQEKGMEVARRTVAKYREQMNILPSHQRKQR
jgi:RNA polymerase sigma-54 factor